MLRCGIRLQPAFVNLTPHSLCVHASGAAFSRRCPAMTVLASSSPPTPAPLLSIAPMMDWTDVHYRQLARFMSRHTWLYTEMVVDSTLIHNPEIDRFLWFPPEQRPIVCQLGGSNPAHLARAAEMVERYGYDEINLNCGCPSDRVAGAGCFGAAMMLQPQLVADCCKAMAEVTNIPITVKCRIGVDNVDSYSHLSSFVRVVSEGSPVRHFIIHARKCLLEGLNPHQNRTVPPLRYEWLVALKRDFPHLHFTLNGGVQTLQEARSALTLQRADPCWTSGAESASSSSNSSGSSGSGSDAGGMAVGGSRSGEGVGRNGDGMEELDTAQFGQLDIAGVMIGRAAYNAPWDVLADADRSIYGAECNACTSRRQVLEAYAVYADGMIGRWKRGPDGYNKPNVRNLVKPLLGMFSGEPRGKKWRTAVDEQLKIATTVSEVLNNTYHILLPETLDAPPKATVPTQVALSHLAPELPCN